MTDVVVSPAADRDVDGIFDFLHIEGGPDAAADFEKGLDTIYQRLAHYPESGAPRPSLGPNIRLGIVRPYVIVYRYAVWDDRIEILRVLHGRRDIATAMTRPKT